ncbi:MAG: substrate-binding periplasmic protein [Nitrospinales bacterium]
MKIKLFVLIVTLCTFNSQFLLAGELTILTENLPPLNYIENGTLVGPTVEMVQEIQRRIGSNEIIQVYPWARAYKMALEEENIILFGMTRTEEREDQFYWIGPIARKRDIFAAKKDSGIRINNLEDAKKVSHIGTLRDDIKEIFLKKHGFTNLVPTHDDQRNAKKLVLGRIDLWATKSPGLKTICRLAGINYHEIEEVYSMRESTISIAVSKKTSGKIVKKWTTAFTEMLADGTILQIQKNWNKKLDDDPFPEIAD